MYVTEETPDPSSVHLELESQPESVALVRAMLAGVAEQLEFETDLLDELNTTVSEACNNVVQHAYADGVGPLMVDLDADDECVQVTIRDHGIGLEPDESWLEDRAGVGLPLMSALADRYEVRAHPDGGTEVRLAFSRDRAKPAHGWREASADGAAPALDIPGDVVGTLAPVNLLGGVLGRMGRLLAARARFSLERFSDLYLLFDQLAFHASRRTRGPRMTFSLSAQTRRLQLEIGPIAGEADGASACGDEPPTNLRVLADELTVEPVDGALVLRVVVGGAAQSEA
jgi:anti-sigma regulatory factor (Ser/Thr protein kinase)